MDEVEGVLHVLPSISQCTDTMDMEHAEELSDEHLLRAHHPHGFLTIACALLTPVCCCH
jgi:hypothetical protein